MADPEDPHAPRDELPRDELPRDELLAMLDLDGTEVRPPAPGGRPLIEDGAAARTSAPVPSPHALALDAWDVRRGRDLLADSERLRRLGVADEAAADFLAAAFLPDPRLAEDCADPLRLLFLGELFATPAYRSLHAATALCGAASEVAAVSFAERFAELALREQEVTAAARRAGGGATGGVLSDGTTDVIHGDFARELSAARAASSAATTAADEVEALTGAATALGLGPGTPGSADARAVAALFRRVRSDPALRRVCDLAGRFRRVAQSKRRQAAHGSDDVVGVTLDGDPARLLAAELVRLADPALERDALRRIGERQALCREHRATEPAGKGPVVVVVDESGSMSGAKVEAAKALALAVAWVARKQKRWAALVAYSGGTGERLLALPPGRWDAPAVADWVAAFLGGGSSLDVPVAELPGYFRTLKAPHGITDVLVITDAACRIPAELAAAFNLWKKGAKARVVALVVGDQPPGDLTLVCDECHAVAALTPDDPTVGQVLDR